VRAPENPFKDMSVEHSQETAAMLVRLYWQMTLTHLLCSFSNIAPRFTKSDTVQIDRVFALIATCLQIFNLIQICHFFFVVEDHASGRT
jgi:hypothetical protein